MLKFQLQQQMMKQNHMQQQQVLMQLQMMKPSQVPQYQELLQQVGQQVFGQHDEEKRPLQFGFFHDEEKTSTIFFLRQRGLLQQVILFSFIYSYVLHVLIFN